MLDSHFFNGLFSIEIITIDFFGIFFHLSIQIDEKLLNIIIVTT